MPLNLPARFNAVARQPHGAALLEYLQSDRAIEQLKTATRLGVPALAGLDEEAFPQVVQSALLQADSMHFKQFVGAVCRAILAEHGFEPAKESVRLSKRSRFFTSATVYRSIPQEAVELLAERIRQDVHRYQARTGASREDIVHLIFNAAPQ